MQTEKKVLDADVLIVGYGPVGAALGCLLGKYDIQALVIDVEADVLEHPRAIALDNEALRILQMTGLPEDSFEKVVLPKVRMWSQYFSDFSEINTTGSINGHPKLVTFFQPELERALRKQVGQCSSVQTMVSTELVSYDEHYDHIEALLRTSEGEHLKVRCRYLVGADGAKSMVRKSIGLAFTGKSHAEDWLIIDALNAPKSIDHLEFICDHRRPGPHMVAPGGRQRWEFMLHPGEDPEQMLRDESIAKLLEPWGSLSEITIERKAIYRSHSRCAKAFSRGRVFLVGDAAHITPPFAGQGLVAGLRDAANLAWKFSWVLKGRSPEAVLKTYSQERRPHAKAMILLARMMGKLVMPTNAVAAILTHGPVRASRLLPGLRRLTEEAQVKPANRFKKGFFLSTPKGAPAICGGQLSQQLVRKSDGEIVLSDDLFSQGFSLVGFGVDPLSNLSAEKRKMLEDAGISSFYVYSRGGNAGSAGSENSADNALEDIADNFVSRDSRGWVALVRPDCVVMGIDRIENLEALLHKTKKYFPTASSAAVNNIAFA